ncbi:AAA family ATPase [Nocardia sp. NPDC052001]|uniref:AAA family ATPase n=1 Tax=Nocardia sp. NPDC052001 TaxID=3154853 RepID=UPI00341F2304
MYLQSSAWTLAMIKWLQVKNWRNYEDAEFEFGQGTTFVVASNGVGKTSVVEAARWALFGIQSAGGCAAIRAGEDFARISVQLELPDHRLLTVDRIMQRKNRPASVAPVVQIDGQSVPAHELDRYLVEYYRTDPNFLASLTMPTRQQIGMRPIEGDLEQHLGRFYGVDGLREVLKRLDSMRRKNDAEVKQIKAASVVTPARLRDLQAAVERAASAVEQTTAAHDALQLQFDRARDHERLVSETEAWGERQRGLMREAATIAAKLPVPLASSPVDIDTLDNALEAGEADLNRRLSQVQANIAVCRNQQESLGRNQHRLDLAAHDDCPVCRRPLDDVTIDSAQAANTRDNQTLKQTLTELGVAEAKLAAELKQIQIARGEWMRIPRPGPPPQLPQENTAGNTSILKAELDSALQAVVTARANHQQASREFSTAQGADEAMRKLEGLFTQAAKIKVTRETTEATLLELLDETIRPLASEVNERWRSLFPDRGKLETRADGTITRLVNGQTLAYDSFSTGEGMTASILTRLLVTQLATTADFCWFDEPLEHLDPDVRRKVASLLSQVAGPHGPLRQVVVTTYEERLARLLEARDPKWVKLVQVRHA